MKQLIKSKPRKLNFLHLTLILLSLNPIVWFWNKGGAILNGVDINFPLDPIAWFLRRLFVWNSIANAGSDFSSSTAGLFFHLIQVIPSLFGLGLRDVQIVSLIFWFAVVVFSAFALARLILPQKKIFQLLFVILYSYNIYLFNSWENVKVANLSLVVSIPLGISILILLRDQKLTKVKALVYSFLLGILVSGAGINPSYIATFFLALFIFSVSIWSFKNFFLLVFAVILSNLFWILPTFSHVLTSISPSKSIVEIGFTNWVQSLSENTSLLNVMRLQGAWDWYAVDSITGLPLYISYALNYFYKLPFIAFGFITTTFVIASFLIRDNKSKYLYISFGLMFIVGIFLGAGTHPPTGYFFNFLSSHLPFFTLFRSPWYIFTSLVTLAFAGLISLFFYTLDSNLSRYKLGWPRQTVYVTVVILIVGNLFYSYPLVTGKIFRYNRPDNFFVKFPDYVFDTQKWLKDSHPKGRIITYPDDEIENFDWGYRGIESVMSLLSDSEILFSSLNMSDSPVSRLVKEFYLGMKKEEPEKAYRLASKINLGFVFEKSDQFSLSPGLPGFIKALPKTTFGKWSFYELDKNLYTPKIYAGRRVFFTEPYDQGQKVVGISGRDEILLNPQDTVATKITGINEAAGKIIGSESSHTKELNKFTSYPSVLSERLVARDPTVVNFDIKVEESGLYSPILERYKLEDFGIEPSSGLNISVDGELLHWEVNSLSDSYVYFKPIILSKGDHKLSISLNNRSLVGSGTFEEAGTYEKLGNGRFQIEEGRGGMVLGILNIGEGNPEPSANFKVESFDPMQNYLIQLKYRQIYGNNASAVIFQGNKNTLLKAQTERLPNYPEWNSFSFYYEPVRSASEMKVALVAPFTADPLGTKVFYDDVSVYKIFSNRLIFVKDAPKDLVAPSVEYKKINPTRYTGKVKGSSGSHLIVFSENYSKDWEMAVYDMGGKKLNLQPIHFSVNTYANSWYMEGSPDQYNFIIYNKHQNLFWLGTTLFLVSGATIILFYLKGRGDKHD